MPPLFLGLNWVSQELNGGATEQWHRCFLNDLALPSDVVTKPPLSPQCPLLVKKINLILPEMPFAGTKLQR